MKVDARPAPIALRNASPSVSMCRPEGPGGCGLFDREYVNDRVATPFRGGTRGAAPVLPGAGLCTPAGTAGS